MFDFDSLIHAFDGVPFVTCTVAPLAEGAGVARSIKIVITTPFLLIGRVCFWTLIMRYGLSAFGRNEVYVKFSDFFESVVSTASGGL